MKLGTGTIGTVIFAAIGTAAFVWMAKRPAVDTTAMQFGMVNNEAQVDSASAGTPANMKDEPTTPSNDQNTVTESTTAETANTSAHADDNASVETKGSADEKTTKEDIVDDVVKKEEINDNAAVEKSDDSSDVAPKEPESVTSDKPETAKPVIKKSTPVVPAIPIMPDMPAGKPAELHTPVPTTTIEEVKTPEVDTTGTVESPSETSTVSEPAVSEPVVSPDNVPPGHKLEPKAPVQMDTPAETVTPSQAQGAENGITTEPVTQSAGDQINTSSEDTNTEVSAESSSSTSVKKEDDVVSDPDKKRLPKTITIRTDEIFGKSLPANLTNKLPETIEIPVDLLFDRSATEE